jgi:ATP/maltotriose-dependent transcriptional regulator MalT
MQSPPRHQESASRLALSLPTVIPHASNIYSKLWFNNRTQAIAKARSFGILSSV